jgi:hypothetical protein
MTGDHFVAAKISFSVSADFWNIATHNGHNSLAIARAVREPRTQSPFPPTIRQDGHGCF